MNENKFYKDKIYFEILKPMYDYYATKYSDEITASFCRVLSVYSYKTLTEVKDELLAEFKTFPKLPNWIEKCKTRLSSPQEVTKALSTTLKNVIEELKEDKGFLYIKEESKKAFTEPTFISWLRSMLLIIKTDTTILMSTDTEFKADYINKNFMHGTKIKHSSGDSYWTRKGIKQFWQEAQSRKMMCLHNHFSLSVCEGRNERSESQINPNIEKVELKSINEINNSFIKKERESEKQKEVENE